MSQTSVKPAWPRSRESNALPVEHLARSGVIAPAEVTGRALYRPAPYTRAPNPALAAGRDRSALAVALVAAALIVAQGAVWCALALHFEGSLRLDVAEGMVYGPEWQLSYPKHPPLTYWLTALAWYAGPLRYTVLFLTSFAFALGSFAIVAAFLGRNVGRGAGTVALLAGLASSVAAYMPLQLNHNIGVMPFWAATLWMAWQAFERRSLGWWVALGTAVGCGLWAKYAILHLLIPLGAFVLLIPSERRCLRTPGPWIALATAALIFAPQLADIIANGESTIAYAVRRSDAGLVARLEQAAEVVAWVAIMSLPMAAVTAAAAGVRPILVRMARSLQAPTRLDLFLHVAAFGPVAIVVLAVLVFGVHPRPLWVTPFTLSFAAWWANLAAGAPRADRAAQAYGVWAAVFIGAYLAMRLVVPAVCDKPQYADMDGPALARLAEQAWASDQPGPIPYLISFGAQHGRQAAGSIAFDLPYPVHVIEGGASDRPRGIDAEDIARSGALIVSTEPLAAGKKILGREIAVIETVRRPVRRGHAPPISFGILRPAWPLL